MTSNTTRNLILAAAATAGLVAVSLPAAASADCYQRRADDRATGTILGAVIGGGLGSSIAHGRSRGAGTVAGAIAGAAIGNSVGGSRDCYYNRGYARSGYTDDGYYDQGYGRTVYVEPQPYGYYEPGYNYYGRHDYRPAWHHRGW